MWGEHNKAITSRSILDYFSKEHSKVNFHNPRGPLSNKILTSTIAAANTEVIHVMNDLVNPFLCRALIDWRL